ncbi:MAG: acyl-ACP--UDP-N-acetylglucosamine O-acyltransferase [Fimbriimonas sp.]
MARIHPLSYVDPGAELGEDVEVGPFCYVESDVVIGARTRLDAYVQIKRHSFIGADSFLGKGAVIGSDPQDRKFKGERSFVRIGDRTILREYVTVHRSSGEDTETYIGNDCFLMAYVHIGHNVTVGNHVTMANSTGVSGHCVIEDLVTLGGMTGVHQWCRIGKVSMVGGMTKVSRDIPPFMLVEGAEQTVHDINAVGLRRMGVTPPVRLALHKACKLLFKSQLGLTNAIATVRREVPCFEEVEYLLRFEEQRFKGKNGRGNQP